MFIESDSEHSYLSLGVWAKGATRLREKGKVEVLKAAGGNGGVETKMGFWAEAVEFPLPGA